MTSTEPQAPQVQPWLLEMLRCPVSGARLRLDAGTDGEQVLVSEADEPLIYPVRDGVPVLLADEARPLT